MIDDQKDFDFSRPNKNVNGIFIYLTEDEIKKRAEEIAKAQEE